jgi:hypothetical protein
MTLSQITSRHPAPTSVVRRLTRSDSSRSSAEHDIGSSGPVRLVPSSKLPQTQPRDIDVISEPK